MSAERSGARTLMGGELLLRPEMIFLAAICTGAFTLLGHEAACWCSNTELTINQGWESCKTAQAELVQR